MVGTAIGVWFLTSARSIAAGQVIEPPPVAVRVLGVLLLAIMAQFAVHLVIIRWAGFSRGVEWNQDTITNRANMVWPLTPQRLRWTGIASIETTSLGRPGRAVSYVVLRRSTGRPVWIFAWLLDAPTDDVGQYVASVLGDTLREATSGAG